MVALQRAEASVVEHDSAEARRELGSMYYIDDRFEDAQRQLELAFRMFREAGQPRDAARVAIDLAGLHGSIFGQLAAGSGWVERARMLLEQGRTVRGVGLSGADADCMRANGHR